MEEQLDALNCKHCGARMGNASIDMEVQENGNHVFVAHATVGWILMGIGLFGLAWALQLDTSVASRYGERVHNIGLLNTKQNYVIAGGVVAIVGALLAGLGSRK
jgi:hypothetical protein